MITVNLYLQLNAWLTDIETLNVTEIDNCEVVHYLSMGCGMPFHDACRHSPASLRALQYEQEATIVAYYDEIVRDRILGYLNTYLTALHLYGKKPLKPIYAMAHLSSPEICQTVKELINKLETPDTGIPLDCFSDVLNLHQLCNWCLQTEDITRYNLTSIPLLDNYLQAALNTISRPGKNVTIRECALLAQTIVAITTPSAFWNTTNNKVYEYCGNMDMLSPTLYRRFRQYSDYTPLACATRQDTLPQKLDIIFDEIASNEVVPASHSVRLISRQCVLDALTEQLGNDLQTVSHVDNAVSLEGIFSGVKKFLSTLQKTRLTEFESSDPSKVDPEKFKKIKISYRSAREIMAVAKGQEALRKYVMTCLNNLDKFKIDTAQQHLKKMGWEIHIDDTDGVRVGTIPYTSDFKTLEGHGWTSPEQLVGVIKQFFETATAYKHDYKKLLASVQMIKDYIDKEEKLKGSKLRDQEWHDRRADRQLRGMVFNRIIATVYKFAYKRYADSVTLLRLMDRKALKDETSKEDTDPDKAEKKN